MSAKASCAGAMSAQEMRAESLLCELAEITAEREVEALEWRLLAIMRDLLEAREVGWLRIDRSVDRYVLARLPFGEPAELPPHRQDGRLCDVPPQGWSVLGWSALLAATSSEHPVCIGAGTEAWMVYPMRDPDSTLGWLLVHAPARDTDDTLVTAVLRVLRNHYALLEDNHRDKLTGLLNRKTFDERIGKLLHAIASSSRPHPKDERRRALSAGAQRFWLAVADVDHFKRINDSFGHLYGDEVLLLLAQLMKRSFRHEDVLFRFGGEEFVIVISAPDRGSAGNAFDKFRRNVETFVFPQIDQVTVSLGITEIEERFIPSALVGRADQALYHAKESGRNRLCFYEDIADMNALAEQVQRGSIELF